VLKKRFGSPQASIEIRYYPPVLLSEKIFSCEAIMAMTAHSKVQVSFYSLLYGVFEGKTRHWPSIAVHDRPPSGSWSGVLITNVGEDPLEIFGVPANVPVKNWFASYN
jgi:hypothetical protein